MRQECLELGNAEMTGDCISQYLQYTFNAEMTLMMGGFIISADWDEFIVWLITVRLGQSTSTSFDIY